jgi:hypothetical protein
VTVAATFDNDKQAALAIQALLDAGYRDVQISAILLGVGIAVFAGAFLPLNEMLTSIVDTLVGLGYDRITALGFYAGVVAGRSLVLVQTPTSDADATELLLLSGGRDVDVTGET